MAPVLGSVAFVCMYIAATLMYPGGSQADKSAEGFSWLHNYWCNLLNDNAINGKPNTAQPIAMGAMLVLALTITAFWYVFAEYATLNRIHRLTILVPGALSMLISVFLFTSWHDNVITAACILGFVAIIGVNIGLLKHRWKGPLWLSVFNIALVAVNNILYYNAELLQYLPVVQKISFLSFLIWICWTDILLFRSAKK